MKKGDIIEGIIEKYSFPNKGSFVYREELGDGSTAEKTVLPGDVIDLKKKSCKII